jgi:hypothetical protein
LFSRRYVILCVAVNKKKKKKKLSYLVGRILTFLAFNISYFLESKG